MKKHDVLEVPVAPRPGEILALRVQENLDLLMALTFQRHEEAAHNTSTKLPKTELEPRKQTFPDVTYKLDDDCLLNELRPQRYQGCARNCKRSNTVVGQMESGKRRFDCAGASGSKAGPFRKLFKNHKGNAICEQSRTGFVVLQKILKSH